MTQKKPRSQLAEKSTRQDWRGDFFRQQGRDDEETELAKWAMRASEESMTQLAEKSTRQA